MSDKRDSKSGAALRCQPMDCPECGGDMIHDSRFKGVGRCSKCKSAAGDRVRFAIERWHPMWVKSLKEIAAMLGCSQSNVQLQYEAMKAEQVRSSNKPTTQGSMKGKNHDQKRHRMAHVSRCN